MSSSIVLPSDSINEMTMVEDEEFFELDRVSASKEEEQQAKQRLGLGKDVNLLKFLEHFLYCWTTTTQLLIYMHILLEYLHRCWPTTESDPGLFGLAPHMPLCVWARNLAICLIWKIW